MKAKGERKPVCPPAPADTQASPSAPAANALRASGSEITSAITLPP